MLKFKRVMLTVACVFALAIVSLAQTGAEVAGRQGPSEPSRPFVVMPAQSLQDLERRLRPEAKAEDLMGGPGAQLRVAVQHERNKAAAAAEVHDASDDVYYVLEGTATLTLGGRLEAPRETEPGEWRAPGIIGGQIVEIRKGDLVVVPRGTPHSRSTVGTDFSMILIKVFAQPLRAQSAQAAASGSSEQAAVGSFTAVVRRDEARFTLPLPARTEWKWRLPETPSNAREYRMDVTVVNGGREYTFGYYLWKRAGARPGSGSLTDLIKAGQESVFERSQRQLFGIVRDGGVSVKSEGSAVVIEVRGRKNIERLFSGRPAEVTFKVETLGGAPFSKTVTVNYQD
jgi:mannose-6-phosphate isomerase-like protein (cupin superfamily)